jgi:G3E family GTPase
VTILTGFLGSGKSSLVKHILTSPKHNRRIAVIENEFGGGDDYGASLAERMGLSVETVIVRDGTSSSSTNGNLLADLIELPNGCVCCTVKDSLVETLERLLERRADLDYVLIEASGMADPGPVASIFWLDGALDSRLRLDGIVCCVDARNVEYQLECTSSSSSGAAYAYDTGCEDGEGRGGGDEAARQIAFADRIILNKVDILLQGPSPDNHCEDSATTIESVIRRIERINPTAPILTTAYSKVDDLGWILDANCFDAVRARDVESAFMRISSMYDDDGAKELVRDEGGFCGEAFCIGRHLPTKDDADPYICGLCSVAGESPSSASRSRHRHTDAVGTIALYGIGSVDLRRINSWLASILWPNQDESDKVLRARLEGRDVPSSTSTLLPRDDDARSIESRQRIYRVKGVLSVRHALDDITGEVIAASNDYVDEGLIAGLVDPDDGSDGRRFIIQAVNDLWDVLPASDDLRWDDTADARCCKVIVIGKWLDEAQLRGGFGDCFVSSSAPG